MIGVTLFRFADETITKELFKENEIPEKLIAFRLHEWFLSHYFPEYVALDRQNQTAIKGFPDFHLIHNSTGKEIFVEFKNSEDGLRKEQLEFVYKHKDQCFVIFYERIKSEYEIDKFQKLIENFKKMQIESIDNIQRIMKENP